MRYYYYGSNKDGTCYNMHNKEFRAGREEQKKFNASDVKISAKADSDMPSDGLIIDDDTVYEIDEECLRCKNKRNGIKFR